MRQQSGEVIVKYEDIFVGGIKVSVASPVAGTHIAGWIVFEDVIERAGLYLALPGTLAAMWRDEYPFPRQRIESAMRPFSPVKSGHLLSSLRHSRRIGLCLVQFLKHECQEQSEWRAYIFSRRYA